MSSVELLIGLAGGSVGTSVFSWLTGRTRQNQLDLAELGSKYWARIDKLELDLAAQQQRIADLQVEVVRLRAENARLTVQLAAVTP